MIVRATVDRDDHRPADTLIIVRMIDENRRIAVAAEPAVHDISPVAKTPSVRKDQFRQKLAVAFCGLF